MQASHEHSKWKWAFRLNCRESFGSRMNEGLKMAKFQVTAVSGFAEMYLPIADEELLTDADRTSHEENKFVVNNHSVDIGSARVIEHGAENE